MIVRQNGIFLCSIFNITVIYVMAANLDSVLHLVMVQQVFDFLGSARENISYYISCPSISDDI